MASSLEYTVLCLVVLLCCYPIFPASGEELQDKQVCTEEFISGCYASYVTTLTSSLGSPAEMSSFTGNETAVDIRICRVIKERLPCHRRMEVCPQFIRDKFRDHEESYYSIEEIFCRRRSTKTRARRDAQAAEEDTEQCAALEAFFECKYNMCKSVESGTRSDDCGAVSNLSKYTTECVNRSFAFNCRIPFDSFMKPIRQACAPLKKLISCFSSGSCDSPRAYVVVLSTIILLFWTTASG